MNPDNDIIIWLYMRTFETVFLLTYNSFFYKHRFINAPIDPGELQNE